MGPLELRSPRALIRRSVGKESPKEGRRRIVVALWISTSAASAGVFQKASELWL
jgi:hypothetical protein